jgi:hypothetical protein
MGTAAFHSIGRGDSVATSTGKERRGGLLNFDGGRDPDVTWECDEGSGTEADGTGPDAGRALLTRASEAGSAAKSVAAEFSERSGALSELAGGASGDMSEGA